MNMKKMFPDDKGEKKGFKEFLDKRGFYIVLLLCIAVVAGTIVFVTTRNATSDQPEFEAKNFIPEEDGNNSEALGESEGDASIAQELENTQASAEPAKQTDIGQPASMTNTSDDSAAQKEDGAADTAASKPSTSSKSTEDASDSKSAAKAEQHSFIMPVSGNISQEFAKDKLVYSKTLEEWRVHPGLDIAADRGTPVKAAADGVICDVRNDAYFGISVVIDHGDGLKSLYRNLASDETVAVNQKVKQGEVIGSIGNTAMDESSEQPHLHFEVLNNDVTVDPMTYLPKSLANAG